MLDLAQLVRDGIGASHEGTGQIEHDLRASPPQASMRYFDREEEPARIGRVHRHAALDHGEGPRRHGGHERIQSGVQTHEAEMICAFWMPMLTDAGRNISFTVFLQLNNLVSLDDQRCISAIVDPDAEHHGVRSFDVRPPRFRLHRRAAPPLFDAKAAEHRHHSCRHEDADRLSPIHSSPIVSRQLDGETAGRAPQGLGRSVLVALSAGAA